MSKKTENVRVLHVLKPEMYKRMFDEHKQLLFYQSDPLINHVMEMRRLLPAILESNDLDESEKMRRYTIVVQKLNDLTDQQFKKVSDPERKEELTRVPPEEFQPPRPQLVKSSEATPLTSFATPKILASKMEFNSLSSSEATPVENSFSTPTQSETSFSTPTSSFFIPVKTSPRYSASNVESGTPRKNLLDLFPERVQKRAGQVFRAIEDNDQITVSPGTNLISVSGKKIPGSNLVDVVHDIISLANLPSQQKMSHPPAVLTVLHQLAKNSDLPAHTISNKVLRDKFMEFRTVDTVGPGSRKRWITSENLERPKRETQRPRRLVEGE